MLKEVVNRRVLVSAQTPLGHRVVVAVLVRLVHTVHGRAGVALLFPARRLRDRRRLPSWAVIDSQAPCLC